MLNRFSYTNNFSEIGSVNVDLLKYFIFVDLFLHLKSRPTLIHFIHASTLTNTPVFLTKLQKIDGISVNDELLHEILNELDVSYNGRLELWDYFQVKTIQMHQLTVKQSERNTDGESSAELFTLNLHARRQRLVMRFHIVGRFCSPRC